MNIKDISTSPLSFLHVCIPCMWSVWEWQAGLIVAMISWLCRVCWFNILVASLSQWWFKGRIAGRMIRTWMNRRLMLRRVVPHLRMRDLQKGGQYEGGWGGEEKEVGIKSGRQEEETRDGRSVRQREEWKNGGHTSILYCTHSMMTYMPLWWTALSFEPLRPLTVQCLPVGLFQHGWRGDGGSWVVVWKTAESWTVVRTLCLRGDICLGRKQKWGRWSYIKSYSKFIIHCCDWDIFKSEENTNS